MLFTEAHEQINIAGRGVNNVRTAKPATGLIYRLEDRPPIASAAFGALQHVLAGFAGIITSSLIIGGMLALSFWAVSWQLVLP